MKFLCELFSATIEIIFLSAIVLFAYDVFMHVYEVWTAEGVIDSLFR